MIYCPRCGELYEPSKAGEHRVCGRKASGVSTKAPSVSTNVSTKMVDTPIRVSTKSSPMVDTKPSVSTTSRHGVYLDPAARKAQMRAYSVGKRAAAKAAAPAASSSVPRLTVIKGRRA